MLRCHEEATITFLSVWYFGQIEHAHRKKKFMHNVLFNFSAQLRTDDDTAEHWHVLINLLI